MIIRSLHIVIYLLGVIWITPVLADNKPVIGWIEPVAVLPEGLILQAKIDTGADNSSIDAIDLKEYNQGDDTWVQFRVADDNGDRQLIKRPIVRYTTIKRRGVAPQERPVIQLNICLGEHSKVVEVNLANRKSYNYKMLIGRSFLEGLFIVDSDLVNSTTPGCVTKSRAATTEE